MIEPVVSAGTVTLLVRYLAQWLRGLSRASEERKAACIQAIEAVIVAVRKTERYARARDAGQTSAQTEAELAAMWTELGFKLDKLGVRKLAKRCDLQGRYLASPETFSAEWWDQADIGLTSLERLAHRIIADVKANGAPPT